MQQRRHYGDYREGLCYWVVIHVCNEIRIITHSRPRLESYVNTSTNTTVDIAYMYVSNWSGVERSVIIKIVSFNRLIELLHHLLCMYTKF